MVVTDGGEISEIFDGTGPHGLVGSVRSLLCALLILRPFH